MSGKPELSVFTIQEGTMARQRIPSRSHISAAATRHSNISPVSPLFARRASTFSLQFTPSNASHADVPSSSLVFTPIEEGETLSSRVLNLVEEAVKGPDWIPSLYKLETVFAGQRILSVRNFASAAAANKDLWCLTSDSIITFVKDLLDRWRFTDDSAYDELYLVVMESALMLCVIKSIAPWPFKADRLKLYAKLSDLEISYSKKGLSNAFLRELIILTTSCQSGYKSYIRRIIDASQDQSLNFDHDSLVVELTNRTVMNNWVEKLILIAEALRTPTDSFVSFILGLISDIAGISRRSSATALEETDHTSSPTKDRLRDISLSVIDGTKLSSACRQEVFVMGLLIAVRSSISTAFSHSSCAAISRLVRIMISRRIHVNIALSLFEALDSPQEVILSDIWPRPTTTSEPKNFSSSIEGTNKYLDLESRVRSSNETIVQSLRDIITCSLCNDISEDMVNLSCGHFFDRSMITQWLSQSTRCPQCRQTVTIQGRALWVSGIVDLIKEVDSRTSLIRTLQTESPDDRTLVGIFMNTSVTVIGIQNDKSPDIELVSDWAADTSFAVSSLFQLWY